MDKPTPDPLTQTVKNRLQDLTDRLGGELKYQSFKDSQGRSGTRITIQYNHAESD